MNTHLTRLSKTIAHALRHKPEEYGLKLDAEGWVTVDALLEALQHHGFRQPISRAEIEEIIATSEKQRFEIQDNKIRAFYGHSTTEKIEKEPAVPPITLYHGTSPEAAKVILREGLRSMKRQYVHLSTDTQTARKVALRHTRQPVILSVAARQAHEQGIAFYLGNEDIWLADPIPPTFISL